MVVEVAALAGPNVVARTLAREGCSVLVCCGWTPWVLACTTIVTQSRNTHVLVQSKSTWDVVVTWLGLLWARGPVPLPISHHVALLGAYLCMEGEWASSCQRLAKPGCSTRVARSDPHAWRGRLPTVPPSCSLPWGRVLSQWRANTLI